MRIGVNGGLTGKRRVVIPQQGMQTLQSSADLALGFIPVQQATYSQSSQWSGSAAISNTLMTNKSFNDTGVATNLGANENVRIDFGDVYLIGSVIIGTATSNIPGGWNKSYTENANVQFSLDNTNWTTLFNTGGFPSNGIYTFGNYGAPARYLRIIRPGTNYLAISEFYALAPGQTY